jgi:hypothetical protein
VYILQAAGLQAIPTKATISSGAGGSFISGLFFDRDYSSLQLVHQTFVELAM